MLRERDHRLRYHGPVDGTVSEFRVGIAGESVSKQAIGMVCGKKLKSERAACLERKVSTPTSHHRGERIAPAAALGPCDVREPRPECTRARARTMYARATHRQTWASLSLL